MFNYHAFGLNISSELELPGILKASNNNIDIEISLGRYNLPPKQDTPNLIKDQKDVYLWWDDIGEVKISEGNKITINNDNINKDKIIPFILGPVMAATLHQRGFMVLHGSSVKIKDYAIAFLGYSGFGKSTTAIHLYEKGYPLITDDLLVLKFNKNGYPTVYPGYPHVRLSDQTYNKIKDITHALTNIRTIADKGIYDSSRNFTPEPTRLKAVYILQKSKNIKISPLNSQRDLIELITHSTAQRIFDNTDQAENLIQCSNLINNTHFRRLETNHSFKDIDKLIELIEDDLSNIKISLKNK